MLITVTPVTVTAPRSEEEIPFASATATKEVFNEFVEEESVEEMVDSAIPDVMVAVADIPVESCRLLEERGGENSSLASSKKLDKSTLLMAVGRADGEGDGRADGEGVGAALGNGEGAGVGREVGFGEGRGEGG